MYFMLVCAGAEQRQRERESSKRPSRELRRERERVLSGLAGN